MLSKVISLFLALCLVLSFPAAAEFSGLTMGSTSISAGARKEISLAAPSGSDKLKKRSPLFWTFCRMSCRP